MGEDWGSTHTRQYSKQNFTVLVKRLVGLRSDWVVTLLCKASRVYVASLPSGIGPTCTVTV